ncbi:hypothetical protein EVAR_72436_1, partial [Eumeta japonica]
AKNLSSLSPLDSLGQWDRGNQRKISTGIQTRKQDLLGHNPITGICWRKLRSFVSGVPVDQWSTYGLDQGAHNKPRLA